MATIAAAITALKTIGDRGVRRVLWEEVGDDDDGAPVEMSGFADRSVQVVGTFDGATIVIEGSNDGTNYHTLNDPQGNALTITSAKTEQILEVTRWIRCRVSVNGAGSTDLDVYLVLRR